MYEVLRPGTIVLVYTEYQVSDEHMNTTSKEYNIGVEYIVLVLCLLPCRSVPVTVQCVSYALGTMCVPVPGSTLYSNTDLYYKYW